MMVSPFYSIIAAIFFTSITGAVGFLFIFKSKKVSKSDSKLMITEARIAQLLTDINKIVSQDEDKKNVRS